MPVPDRSFFIRLLIAFAGFWILLGMAPGLVVTAGSYGWIAAGGLALILVTWNARYVEIVRWLLCARSVDDSALTSRFANLVDVCKLATPRLEWVDLRGGVFANAVALPSLRQSAVVMSDTLLTRFDDDEVLAICAHELAHLEHHNRSLLRRRSVVIHAVIVIGVLISPILQLVVPHALAILPQRWMVAVLVCLVTIRGHQQKHETESDVRAVELTHNPEALVRGSSSSMASRVSRVVGKCSSSVTPHRRVLPVVFGRSVRPLEARLSR